MNEQFSLFPSPPPPPRGSALGRRIESSARSHTIFFALRPTVADARRIIARTEADKARLGIRGEPMDAERLHVTLYAMAHYVDAFPERQVERWVQAATTMARAPVEIVFDRLVPFGRDGSALALASGDGAGAAPVLRFWRVLGATLAEFDEAVTRQAFQPHMTVSYGDAIPAALPTAPVRWTAHELVLIDSHVGAHIHEVLGRWLLQEQAASP